MKVLVRLLVSVALMYFVLRSIDLAALWLRVKGMNPTWIALALVSYVFIQAVNVWRWRRLLRAQHVDVATGTLRESMWVSLFFNNFLPSGIGGDVMRIADTAPAAGSKTLATTVILVDRAIGLAAMILVACLGAFAASLVGIHVPGARWLWIVAGTSVVLAIPVIVIPSLTAFLLRPLRLLKRPWVDERVQRLDDAIGRFRETPSTLFGAFAGALVVQVTVVVFYLLTAEGLAIPLPILLGAVLIPVSLAVQMVPVSINGFGVREAVFAFFFRRFGLPIDAAVALSLVSTGLVMGLSLVGGLMFLRRRSTSHAAS